MDEKTGHQAAGEGTASSAPERPANAGAEEAGAPSGDFLEETDQGTAALLEAATAWIEKNQTLAMLGAFAAGVFIGVMIRR